jgi:transcriptional regulator with XRE-family HTH domain
MDDVRAMLGRNIRVLRLKRGWTLEELAFRSGVHANYLGDAERGRRNLSLASLNKIARGLGVEPAVLLRGTPKAPENRDEKLYRVARRFVSLVRDKTAEEQRTLLRILREASRGMRPRRGKRSEQE